MIAAGLVLERPLLELFRIADASQVYSLVLIAFALMNISALFLSVLRGIQRMDESNSVEIRMSIANVVGTVVFLESGLGILGLAVNALINVVTGIGLAIWTAKRTLPQLRLGWHFDGELLWEMLRYGTKVQVSRLGGLVCFQLDKLIISRFLGMAPVSFYEVSSRLTSFMRAIPLVMISVLIPATSELDARKDPEKIIRTYRMASRYVAMVTVPLVAFVVLEARSLLALWLGTGFDDSVILVQILAIGYGVNVLVGAASQIGAGIGRPEFDMRSTLVLTVLNPVLSLLLVRRFGAPGAAAGTSLALFVAALYLLFVFHRGYLGSSVLGALRSIHLRPFLASVVAASAVAGFHRLFPSIGALESIRYLTFVRLTGDFAVFGATYVLLLVALRQVNTIDWRNFVGLVSFEFDFIRHPSRERVKIYR